MDRKTRSFIITQTVCYSPNWLFWFNDPDTVPLAFTCRNSPTRPNNRILLEFVGNLVKFTQLLSLVCTLGLLLFDVCLRSWELCSSLVPDTSSVFRVLVAFSPTSLNPREEVQLGTGERLKTIKICWKYKRQEEEHTHHSSVFYNNK